MSYDNMSYDNSDAPQKPAETIPDLRTDLMKAFANANNIDHQVWRLERAYGKDRASNKGDEEKTEPTIITVENWASDLVNRLDQIEKNLRRELDRLLGEEQTDTTSGDYNG